MPCWISQPTLTNGDSLTGNGPNNVLTAFFHGDHTANSLNITGVQTFNIDQAAGDSTITLLGGSGIGGGPVISGIHTLNFNDEETNGELHIGDNASPVVGVAGAFNNFTINARDSTSGSIDIDFAAAGFTGSDTINVNVTAVSIFPEENGSFLVPTPIIVAPDNLDDYNPNWQGYLDLAFAISAGASSGPSGPVGFQNWVISSTGAAPLGAINILALERGRLDGDHAHPKR